MNYRDLSYRVQFMMKTRQDSDVTDCISIVYTEHEIELS